MLPGNRISHNEKTDKSLQHLIGREMQLLG
jgi:hypothetical protein